MWVEQGLWMTLLCKGTYATRSQGGQEEEEWVREGAEDDSEHKYLLICMAEVHYMCLLGIKSRTQDSDVSEAQGSSIF